ncbi:MAG: hypothetical protein N2259_03185 [Patescibacteria group bacterium]|nr:hypothetical protein [Patescibacteria group bacterium]
MKIFFTNKKICFLFLCSLFILAFLIRFWLIPYAGYRPDLNFWQEWAKSITKFGVLNAYEQRVNPEVMLPNYFPPYLYVLALIGKIYQKFFSPNFELNTYPLYFLLKLPAIVFDLLTGLFIFFLLRKQFQLKFWLAFFILALYLFNPGLIYDSAYWGQVDSIHTFFILLALFFVTKNKFSFSWIFLTIAFLFKMQSIIFFPLIFCLNWQKKGFLHLFKNIGLAILTALIICLPFILSGKIFSVIKIPFLLAGQYSYLSVYAFNFWWLYYPYLTSDLAKFLGLFPYFLVGFIFFFTTYFWAVKNLLKNSSPKIIYLTSAFLTFSFFMLLTRMHERYLYPLFPLMILTLNKDKNLFLIYLLLSLSFFANLAAIAPFRQSFYLFNLSNFSSWVFVFINIFCFLYLFFYLFYQNSTKNKNNHQYDFFNHPYL